MTQGHFCPRSTREKGCTENDGRCQRILRTFQKFFFTRKEKPFVPQHEKAASLYAGLLPFLDIPRLPAGGTTSSSGHQEQRPRKTGSLRYSFFHCPFTLTEGRGERLSFSPRRIRISREHHLPRGFFSRHCPWLHAPVAARTSSSVTAPRRLARSISPLLTPEHQHTGSSSGAFQISCVNFMFPLFELSARKPVFLPKHIRKKGCNFRYNPVISLVGHR